MSTSDTNEIDRQINLAKARQQQQGFETTVNDEPVVQRQRKPRLTQEEKLAQTAEKERVRLEKKFERESLREQRKLEREGKQKNPHMVKIEKQLARLPYMNETVAELFKSLTQKLSVDELETLARHVDVHVRFNRTTTAVSRTINVGDLVRITGGPVAHLGKIAKVTRAQRIRCYVEVPGSEKEVYLFISETEPVAQEDVEQLESESNDNVAVNE